MIPARLLLGPWSAMLAQVERLSGDLLAPVELPRVCDVRASDAPPESGVRERVKGAGHR